MIKDSLKDSFSFILLPQSTVLGFTSPNFALFFDVVAIAVFCWPFFVLVLFLLFTYSIEVDPSGFPAPKIHFHL